MAPYTLPCLDGSLSLLQVIEFHAEKNPDHPLFRYDSASAREGYEDITWRQAVNNFETTAQIIRHRLGGGAVVDCTPPPVVGILASTSTSPIPLSRCTYSFRRRYSLRVSYLRHLTRRLPCISSVNQKLRRRHCASYR